MKSSKTTVRQRVEEVLDLRLSGAEYVDIRRHAEEQGWGVGARQLQRYVAAGDAILADTLEKDREKQLNRQVAQRRALYARAMSVSDYRTALATLDSEAKLLDLFPSTKLQLGGKDNGPIMLHVVEQLVGHKPGTPLNVEEEVVTNDNINNHSPAAPG
jgi:hypothetical protein